MHDQSSLGKINLEAGNTLKLVNVPSPYFAEGLAVLNGKVFQLIWQTQKGVMGHPHHSYQHNQKRIKKGWLGFPNQPLTFYNELID